MNNKTTYIIIFVQFFVILFLEMGSPFLPTYLNSLNENNHAQLFATLSYAAPMIGLIISSPFWGKIGDKYGHKKMLIRALLGLIVSQALISCVQTPLELITIRFMQGLVAGFITAMQCYAISTISWNKKGHVLGQLQSANACGMSLGSIVGGSLIAFTSYRWVFFVAAIGCLISLAIVIFYLPNDSREKQNLEREKIPINTSSTTFVPKLIVFLFLLIAIIQLLKFMPLPFFSLYTLQTLSSNSFITGLLYSIPGITILFFSSPLGRLFDKLRTRGLRDNNYFNIIVYFATLTAIASFVLYLHAISTSILFLIIIRLGWGICLAGLLPSCYSLLTDFCSSSNRGFLIGIANSMAKTGNLCGVLFGGLCASRWGYQAVFQIMSFGYGILFITMLSISAVVIYKNNKKSRYAQIY